MSYRMPILSWWGGEVGWQHADALMLIYLGTYGWIAKKV